MKREEFRCSPWTPSRLLQLCRRICRQGCLFLLASLTLVLPAQAEDSVTLTVPYRLENLHPDVHHISLACKIHNENNRNIILGQANEVIYPNGNRNLSGQVTFVMTPGSGDINTADRFWLVPTHYSCGFYFVDADNNSCPPVTPETGQRTGFGEHCWGPPQNHRAEGRLPEP